MSDWFKATLITILIFFLPIYFYNILKTSNTNNSNSNVISKPFWVSQKDSIVNTINVTNRKIVPEQSKIIQVKDATYIEPSARKIQCESSTGKYTDFISWFLIKKWKTWSFRYTYWMFFSEKIWNCAFYLIDNVNNSNISTINFRLFNWSNYEELIYRLYICKTSTCLDKYNFERIQILNSFK